jgi:hypothetical protein
MWNIKVFFSGATVMDGNEVKLTWNAKRHRSSHCLIKTRFSSAEISGVVEIQARAAVSFR